MRTSQESELENTGARHTTGGRGRKRRSEAKGKKEKKKRRLAKEPSLGVKNRQKMKITRIEERSS
jgi:hypothetical protein